MTHNNSEGMVPKIKFKKFNFFLLLSLKAQNQDFWIIWRYQQKKCSLIWRFRKLRCRREVIRCFENSNDISNISSITCLYICDNCFHVEIECVFVHLFLISLTDMRKAQNREFYTWIWPRPSGFLCVWWHDMDRVWGRTECIS